LKKIFKLIGYTIIGFITIVLIYLAGAFILSRISTSKEITNSADINIYIITNGVHTDIVVPLKTEYYDWSKEIKFSHTKLSDTNVNYLAMGWGDKGFYLETPTWGDLKFSVAFNAVFGLGSTAIHATFYKDMQENTSCKKISISAEQYKRLIQYISNSFQKNNDGHFMNINTKANYGNMDAFYEANGSYSAFKTCNTWANNGLKACGQKACLWTAFDTGIFLKYKSEH
jgi:uncharacterized protein (TIGR02117 family)